MRRGLVVLVALVTPASAGAAPAPTLATSRTVGPAPLLVRFSADASAPDPAPEIVSYRWRFGDGARASGRTVTHRFSRPGRYRVTVTAADALGGTASAHALIRARGLRLALAPSTVLFGDRTVAQGALVPAERGVRVVLERRTGGRWQPLAAARTGPGGRFRAAMRTGRSGLWRARAGRVRSEPRELTVAPRVDVHTDEGVAFAGAPLTVVTRPRSSAPVRVTVLRGGEPVAQSRGRSGRQLTVPTPGVGRFTARIEVAGRTLSAHLSASARTLSYGSVGPDVVALRNRLAALRVHVPTPSSRFGSDLVDSVIAFQKARGLPRTGAVNTTVWRALAQDVVPAPRYRTHGVHLEVSKSRQILMVVRDGETVAYLPISSGAGGITPVGNFSILWKAPSTSTWLGSAILYRTMTIHGNVAIHGYASVPTYPASHGCIRIPIWIADWLYGQSPVGERVYVYE